MNPTPTERRHDFSWEEVLELLVDHSFKDKIWRWQFYANPRSADPKKECVALYRKERLVGFCGIMPVKVKYDNNYYTAYWCCDLYVDAAARRQGIANELYAHVERQIDIGLGFGTSDAAYRLKIKRGWRPSQQLAEFFFHNRAQTNRERAKRLLQRGRRLLFQGTLRNIQAPDDLSSQLEETVDPIECDQLWTQVESGYRRIVVRDGRYMDWKYLQHPGGGYRYLTLRDDQGTLQALAVIRQGTASARIVDYIGPAQAVQMKLALLKSFLNWSADSSMLQVITSCREWQRLLQAYGFLRYSEDPRFTILTKWSQSAEIADDWFVMIGDSDGDMIDAVKDQIENPHSSPHVDQSTPAEILTGGTGPEPSSRLSPND